jgi:hypothetical protein
MTHHCHWPGCPREVPPKLWGCLAHWRMLPPHLQREIWRAYVPGQEITKTPSPAYVEAARKAQAWIRLNHPPAAPPPEARERQGRLFNA